MKKKQESEFETQLIEALTHGEIGYNSYGIYKSKLWTYEKNIKTRDAMWKNFKRILERNNQDKLDHPLSVTEFGQVKNVIESLTTPYKAGQFLYGYNGVSQIEVDLDDGRHVYLTVFDQDQVGAGSTVYQIVNQIESPAIIPGKKNRRFDVTLLINGLPIIQIELKSEHHDVNEALNQMHQYIVEGQYTGIFSTVQILVGMTPYDVRYMANTTADRFNKDFAFHWQREDGDSPVNRWREFADSFLSIPTAHRMSTSYMILDGTQNRECIKVMRPYQVYATKRVIDGIKRIDYESMGVERVGYIWHTTGSGKTITSFKTAWLASRLPGVDKVVFLVDRKALTRQTFERYKAYDPDSADDFSVGKIADTKNTRELVMKLKEKNSDIIITSVQKLEILARRERYEAPDRRYVFIVDEAHRSTGGDAFAAIQKKFKKAAWVGYTGTPKFTCDSSSTAGIFGKCLHSYTIRNAIADRNVLGFKVDFNTTIPEGEAFDILFSEVLKEKNPDLTEEEIQKRVKNPNDKDYDAIPSFYDNNPKHVEAVVDDIIRNWHNRSHDGTYNAILTVSVGSGKSTPMAMMYYDEFKRVNEENAKYNSEHMEEIKQKKIKARPILKVAVTFSQDTSNSDGMLNTNQDLSRAIRDYNQLFGTAFDDSSVQGYMDDLITRLDKTADDKNYLDLVIVVDQLLTGFDAPQMNTLYVDRILKGASLIQAYSRTNRIADMQTKPYGNVVNYRWPKKAEEEMNKALEIYSNANSADEDYDPSGNSEKLVDDGILAKKFPDLLAETRKTVEKLREMTNGFTKIPDSEARRISMLKELRNYNTQIAKLKQYPSDGPDVGYDYDHPEALIESLGMTVDESKILTTTLTNELKNAVAKTQHIQPSDIDLHVEYIKDILVNYDYLTELIEALLNEVHEEKMSKAKKTREEIIEFAKSLPDSSYAKAVIEAADVIYNREFPPEGSDLKYPYHIDEGSDIVNAAHSMTLGRKILDFRNKWGLTDVVTGDEIEKLVKNHTYGVQDLDDSGKLGEIVLKGSNVYTDMSTNKDVRSLKKIKYRNALRHAMLEFADALVAE